MDLSQFRNLDPNNIGSWPAVAKGGLIGLVCVVVLGLGYWFDTKEQLAALERSRQSEIKLKKDFEAKQAKAVNLDAYRQQMVEMEESFGTMLRQLPSKTEVADLLVDITQTGLASGLEFEIFKPGGDTPKEFYAELPIQIVVNGAYHSFGEFVSGVAALPRIVTLHDINISRSTKKGAKSDELIMQANAKTYRYLDEEEIAAARKSQAAAKKKARR
ncbi:type 4a pilus biogenesis protein PilO [Sulfurivermis fontis]|uniref:type 4a pilus biogenesis protein PilO n=1 Tax=Sulfurivermis fontis TaxID=1972068 RepID=UPI000FD93C78|nr:type 4a pilus biogenesis protein PilO [Sulfurivermis fontis]